MFTEVQYLKTNCINRIIFKTQLIFTKFTKTNFVDFDINTLITLYSTVTDAVNVSFNKDKGSRTETIGRDSYLFHPSG